MNQAKLFFILPTAFFLMTTAVLSRDIAPVVSTDWLLQNLGDPRILVLDIRSAEQYKKGHIPGAINAPLGVWAVEANGLNLELPSDKALSDLLGNLGIKDGDSNSVVVVNRVETDFSRADATRVAWTCMLAGIKNVAVLNGGYGKWIKENKPKAADLVSPKPVPFKGVSNRSWVASKSYVLGKIGKSTIVDARIPEDYFGITSRPGHIKGAVNLPTPWVFNADGTFKGDEELKGMATGVVGKDLSKEVLVYCGVGGYASTWWYVLSQIFGYRNVKLYDGSMEEWVKDPKAPVSTYAWH